MTEKQEIAAIRTRGITENAVSKLAELKMNSRRNAEAKSRGARNKKRSFHTKISPHRIRVSLSCKYDKSTKKPPISVIFRKK